MKWVKLGPAELNQTPLDWDGNRDRIVAAIETAKAKHVGLLLTPELCSTGYGCEDACFWHGLGRSVTAGAR